MDISYLVFDEIEHIVACVSNIVVEKNKKFKKYPSVSFISVLYNNILIANLPRIFVFDDIWHSFDDTISTWKILYLLMYTE